MAFTIDIPLNETENFILNDLFESSLPSTYIDHFDTQSILAECKNAEFPQEQVEDALLCLVDRGLLSGQMSMGSSIPYIVRFTDVGFSEMCQNKIEDYDQKKELVARHLAQVSTQESAQLQEIASNLEMPFLVARHFIEFFVNLGWVKWAREDDKYGFITYVSPLMSRAVEDANVS